MTEPSEIQLNIRSKTFVVSPDLLPTQTCHAATLTEIKPGTLMSAWFGGSQEGYDDVRIWGAHYEHDQWLSPILLTPENSTQAHWNPVLFNDGSHLYLYYKVGKSPRTWRGFHSLSADGKHWSPPQPDPEGYLGPIRNKPLSLPNGSILHPSSTEYQGWRVHFEIEMDQKRLHIPVEDPDMLGAIQPTLLTYPNGTIQALCRTHSGVIAETWSNDNGQSWSALEATLLPNPNSAIDAVTLRNGIHLLVHNPVIAGRTPLVISLSYDGQQWDQTITLEEEHGEFSYPAVIEDSKGSIHIAYTWQRKAIRHVVLEVMSQ